MPLIGLKLLLIIISLAIALAAVWLLIRLLRGRAERRGFDIQPRRD